MIFCTNINLAFERNIQLSKQSLHLLKKITNPCESGDIAIGVFLDFKKEFDTVPHDILLKKLFAYGIRGAAFKLLKTYLTGRTQYVIYDGIQSTTLPINCEVPQGSILGPLIIVSMNAIRNVSEFPGACPGIRKRGGPKSEFFLFFFFCFSLFQGGGPAQKLADKKTFSTKKVAKYR